MATNGIREDVSEIASNPRELRHELQGIVEFQDGEEGGYVQLDESYSLNVCAVGLGINNIEYEQSVFDGLVYRYQISDNIYVTILLFSDGQITVVDAPSETIVKEAVSETVERLRELELFDGPIPSEEDIQFSVTDSLPPESVDKSEISGRSESETDNIDTETEIGRDEPVECYKCGAEIPVEEAVLQASSETEEYWQCFGECER